MPWVKLDDQFFANPKVIELSKDAKLLYLGALTHCAAQLTDGYISPSALRLICALVDVPPECAGDLVTAGLWNADGDLYLVNDYLEYNPSADQVKARRRANAERQARFRERHKDEDNADSNGVTNAGSNRRSNKRSNTRRAVKRTKATAGASPDSDKDARNHGEQEESNAVTNALVTASVTHPPSPSPLILSHQEMTKEDAATPPSSNRPYDIYRRLLVVKGADPSKVPDEYKNKQLGLAKNMLDAGYSPDDIIGCAIYMQSQAWRTNPFDLQDVRALIGKWVTDGRPERESTTKRPARGTGTLAAAQQLVQRYEQSGHAGDGPLAIDRGPF